ncbi:sulfite exporter TauE/SafE family protein [Nesterenkonia halophila]
MDAELAIIGIVVLVAACLQGSIGFGLGMLAAPVVALLRPDLLPTTLILLAALTSLYALLRERSSIDGPLFGWAFAGRLPGTALGLLAVTQLPPPALSLTLGATVIGGVWLSIHGWTPRVTRASTATAGALSGLFGTATSIGGPPMALIARNLDPATIRATLSAYFTAGSLLSLVALWAGHAVQPAHLWTALALTPFMAAGLLASNLTRRRLNSRRLYAVAASASVVGAAIVIIEAITVLLTG